MTRLGGVCEATLTLATCCPDRYETVGASFLLLPFSPPPFVNSLSQGMSGICERRLAEERKQWRKVSRRMHRTRSPAPLYSSQSRLSHSGPPVRLLGQAEKGGGWHPRHEDVGDRYPRKGWRESKGSFTVTTSILVDCSSLALSFRPLGRPSGKAQCIPSRSYFRMVRCSTIIHLIRHRRSCWSKADETRSDYPSKPPKCRSASFPPVRVPTTDPCLYLVAPLQASSRPSKLLLHFLAFMAKEIDLFPGRPCAQLLPPQHASLARLTLKHTSPDTLYAPFAATRPEPSACRS